MIFLTIGTQLPFDRLVKAVDKWAGESGITGFAQIGSGQYHPRHLEFAPFIDPDQFTARVQDAACIVSHAGMGTILTAMTHAKPAILMPRSAAMGEHRNEHQMATARKFGTHPLIKIAHNAQEIAAAYASIIGDSDDAKPRLSPHAGPEFIAALRGLIFK